MVVMFLAAVDSRSAREPAKSTKGKAVTVTELTSPRKPAAPRLVSFLHLSRVSIPQPDGKDRSASASGFPPSAPPYPQQQQYGTFVPSSASGEFPQPAVGVPQPAPPPGFRNYPPPPQAPYAVYPPQQAYSAAAPYYGQGYQYQAVQGYIPVVEGRPVRMRRLPCCGLGMGWFLFIMGFFFAAIPWYVGAFVLICVRVHDYREKPGYVACTIAASVAALAMLLGATKGAEVW